MPKFVLSLVMALTLLLGLGGAAQAADPASPARNRPTSVYVVHGIPGVNVDVYVNDTLAIPNFKPGDAVGPVSLPIGCCTNVKLYAAGANPATSSPVLQANAPLPATRGVSIIAHLKADGTPTLSLFTERPEQRAGRGMGQLNVRHTAQFGAVDLYAKPTGAQGELAKVGSGLTNPNTLGLFEKDILEIAEIVHGAGGLLYYDGANANAILGKIRPGDMGFDVLHLNLHKTFSTPHGGGGPGSGPVGVSQPALTK